MNKNKTGLVFDKADFYEKIINHMNRIEDYFKSKGVHDYTRIDLLLIALIEGGYIKDHKKKISLK